MAMTDWLSGSPPSTSHLPSGDMSQDSERTFRWAAATQAMRNTADGHRRANPSAFPWCNLPGSTAPRQVAGLEHLPGRIVKDIFSFLPLDLEVSLRREGDAGTPTYDNVRVVLVNSRDYHQLLASRAANKAFKKTIETAFHEAVMGGSISIVLDTRNSIRSEQDTGAWYNIGQPIGGVRIATVPDFILSQFLALTLISPYQVRGAVKLFSMTVCRTNKFGPVSNYADQSWESIEGNPGADIQAVFDSIEEKLNHPFNEGADFGTVWTPSHLNYFHDMLANVATQHVLEGHENLASPANMGQTLRTYRGLMARKAEAEEKYQARLKKMIGFADGY